MQITEIYHWSVQNGFGSNKPCCSVFCCILWLAHTDCKWCQRVFIYLQCSSKSTVTPYARPPESLNHLATGEIGNNSLQIPISGNDIIHFITHLNLYFFGNPCSCSFNLVGDLCGTVVEYDPLLTTSTINTNSCSSLAEEIVQVYLRIVSITCPWHGYSNISKKYWYSFAFFGPLTFILAIFRCGLERPLNYILYTFAPMHTVIFTHDGWEIIWERIAKATPNNSTGDRYEELDQREQFCCH